MKKITSLHHIIPVSRWWVELRDSSNTVDLNILTHQKLHAAFWNALPHEQILEILNNSNTKIPYCKKNDIYWIISNKDNNIYYSNKIISSLEEINNINLRTWQILHNSKTKKFQDLLFWMINIWEKNILKILDISDSTLNKCFKEKILNIIK